MSTCSANVEGTAPPRLIRWMARWPCACAIFWLAFPIAPTIYFVAFNRPQLTDPMAGWRFKDHETAEALDAFLLAQEAPRDSLHDATSPRRALLQPPPREPYDSDGAARRRVLLGQQTRCALAPASAALCRAACKNPQPATLIVCASAPRPHTRVRERAPRR